MRIAHASDTHLGLTKFAQMTPTGINAREADLARTFTALIDRVIALEPDLFILAGDIFDHVRPTNQAIMFAFRQLRRVSQALPGCRTILAGGNHEIPREGSTAGILPHFEEIDRVHVADRAVRSFWFGDRELSVVAVPDAPGLTRPPLEPDPRAEYSVLVIHGEVEGMPVATGQRDAIKVSRDEAGVDRFSYIGAGHYHVYTKLAENAYYSGATDYSSSDPWRELREEAKAGQSGKGFILRDLETGAHEFHSLPVSRRFLDLPAIEAAGLGVADLDTAIAAALEQTSIDGAVVRLIVNDVTVEVGRAINHAAIRSAKRRALNFNLEMRRPEKRESALSIAVRNPRMSLADLVAAKLGARDLVNDVDRGVLIARALEYLDKAGEIVPASNEPIELAAIASERRLAS